MESENEMIKLRPHHLLCTQGYSGKGYDEKFVLNMTYITDRMRKDPDLKVRIVFSTDDLCRFCPRKEVLAWKRRHIRLQMKLLLYVYSRQKT